MGKIDKAKEYIGAIRIYMTFVLASLVATIAGVSKLYMALYFGVMFWIGIIAIIMLALIFVLLARHMHKKINELEEIYD